ncbi:MAG: outer membrane protein transport protein [Bdellovibrionales bacterium]|nr:outer membrane protein transport protein [Bdellovibrionales bacterium]
MQNRILRKISGWVAVIPFLLTSSTAFGAGFELQEQSGIGLGTAFAGMSTGFGDGSESFWNPAALTQLDGSTATFVGHVIVPSTKFTNEGSSYPALGGIPLSGGDGGDGGEAAFVPNIYFAHEVVPDKLFFGLGINTPFGLSTKWDDGWVGRYHALESTLTTININPTVAYAINDMISIGAGASVMYVDAKLTNAVDFGTIGLANLPPAVSGQLGLRPQSADGTAKLEGDDWAAGANAGVLLTPTEELKIGLGWRSQVKTRVRGDATFDVPANAQALTMTGSFIDTPAQAAITLPQSASAGFHYAITDMIGIAADARWVEWSKFDELRVEFDSSQPDSVVDESWDDSWRYAFGVDIHPSDELAVLLGYAFEETPIPDPEHRTPRIPDLERHWFTAGVSYQLTDSLNLSVSYAYILTDEDKSNILGPTGDNFAGSYDGDVNIISGQLTWNMNLS